jgi:hypothetical protein
MVLSPTERRIICDRKRTLRTRALRLEIGVLLQRIERALDKCIRELETAELEEDCGEELIVGKAKAG